MGCLNSGQGFTHWFGNIHLSGPCNRACYFCIGQHMMALDQFNVLKRWPLPGLEWFVARCRARGVRDVNLTGTNTDPALYAHVPELVSYLRDEIPGVRLGIRTNAVSRQFVHWSLFDHGSVTICSFNRSIYQAMMGRGAPPSEDLVHDLVGRWDPLKINIVLGPENAGLDLWRTLAALADCGVTSVNLREPYGQPHVGDPLARVGLEPAGRHFGMPFYLLDSVEVTYWDVHFCEVESVNLYANGRVSEDYPITRGHDDGGVVVEQARWSHGRHVEQWRTA